MNSWNTTYFKGYALGSILYMVFLIAWSLIFIPQRAAWAHTLLLPALGGMAFAAYCAIQNSRAKKE